MFHYAEATLGQIKACRHSSGEVELNSRTYDEALDTITYTYRVATPFQSAIVILNFARCMAACSCSHYHYSSQFCSHITRVLAECYSSEANPEDLPLEFCTWQVRPASQSAGEGEDGDLDEVKFEASTTDGQKFEPISLEKGYSSVQVMVVSDDSQPDELLTLAQRQAAEIFYLHHAVSGLTGYSNRKQARERLIELKRRWDDPEWRASEYASHDFP